MFEIKKKYIELLIIWLVFNTVWFEKSSSDIYKVKNKTQTEYKNKINNI